MPKRPSKNEVELVHSVSIGAGALKVIVRELRGVDKWPGGNPPYKRMGELAKWALPKPVDGRKRRALLQDMYYSRGLCYRVYRVSLE